MIVINLLTKIIILLTALLGLYKTVKFSPQSITDASSDNNSDSEKSELFTIFKPLLAYISVFLIMLAMPAFIYSFMYIIDAMSNIGVEESGHQEVKIEENLFPENDFENLSNEMQKYYLQMESIINISNSNKKDDYLLKLIREIIRKDYYNLSIKAANEISNSIKRDKMLKLIINEAVENDKHRISLKALSLISNSLKKNDSAIFIYDNLENSLKE